MFRSFFLSREWALWAWGGMAIIIGGTWYQVQVDVQINEWFGEFYDGVQKALGEPGSMTIEEFYALLLSFGRIAGIYIVVAVMLSFFTKHWVFRWRHAMNNFYMDRWTRLRHIEGASQRIQEDTRRFAIIMESLGSRLLDSLMTLVAFLPILWQLSKSIKVVPVIGELDHALVYAAIIFALFGTAVLAVVGIRLPDWSSTTRWSRPLTGRNSCTARTTKNAPIRRPCGSCFSTSAAIISVCSSTTCTSILRSGRICSSAFWCPISRWRRPSSPAPSPSV